MKRHPWIEAVLGDIRKTPLVLEGLHRAAIKGEVLVGRVIDVHGLTEWYILPPGRNLQVIWGCNARQFFMEHDSTKSVIVGVQLLNQPLILFSVSCLDVPSLQFSHRPSVAQIRLIKADQKRQRRAQRNRQNLLSISSN